MKSVKTNILSQLHENNADLRSKHILEVVISIMSELEELKYLSGEEKNQYCIDLIKEIFPNVDNSEIQILIDNVIKLTKAKTVINKYKKTFFKCFK